MESKVNKLLFVLCVLGVAILHFFATFMLAFISGTTGGKATKIATDVLTFPLSMLENGPNNPIFDWGAWALLSLGWGLTFCTIVCVVVSMAKSE